MLNLIERPLKKRGLGFVRLDGSVPQKQRAELVHRFQNDPSCQLFLTTNAGSTGLNLQAANTVINVDLPWNPAILEQRIARAHRMGQEQPVQVFVLVTEGTLEENLLVTLAAKKDLALAALDVESEVDRVDLASGMQELKNRLEILLGARPEAPVDESVKQRKPRRPRHSPRPIASGSRRPAASSWGPPSSSWASSSRSKNPRLLRPRSVANLRAGLSACVDSDPSGKPRLSVTLPGHELTGRAGASPGKAFGRRSACGELKRTRGTANLYGFVGWAPPTRFSLRQSQRPGGRCPPYKTRNQASTSAPVGRAGVVPRTPPPGSQGLGLAFPRGGLFGSGLRLGRCRWFGGGRLGALRLSWSSLRRPRASLSLSCSPPALASAPGTGVGLQRRRLSVRPRLRRIGSAFADFLTVLTVFFVGFSAP